MKIQRLLFIIFAYTLYSSALPTLASADGDDDLTDSSLLQEEQEAEAMADGVDIYLGEALEPGLTPIEQLTQDLMLISDLGFQLMEEVEIAGVMTYTYQLTTCMDSAAHPVRISVTVAAGERPVTSMAILNDLSCT